mgnify:CR=1 FL=1
MQNYTKKLENTKFANIVREKTSNGDEHSRFSKANQFQCPAQFNGKTSQMCNHLKNIINECLDVTVPEQYYFMSGRTLSCL